MKIVRLLGAGAAAAAGRPFALKSSHRTEDE
jgi:hypothetical protein